jgi:putative spermidine/putrescine transport system ATP-binding protein
LVSTNTDDNFVVFDGVQKSYDGENLVVKDLNLSIAKGEFLTMLGPSGSGKTTCLMMLAGFEPATTARFISTESDQQRAAAQARHRHGVPELRPVPAHVGGRKPGVSRSGARHGKAEQEERSSARWKWSSSGFGGRRPAQLVRWPAAARRRGPRAGVRPELVLMDEPLGALDKQLREQMQYEIKHIHESLGVTVVYVTHDQSEH